MAAQTFGPRRCCVRRRRGPGTSLPKVAPVAPVFVISADALPVRPSEDWTNYRKRPQMALTQDQKNAKLKALDVKIAKVEKAVNDIEALRAERVWIESAPVVVKAARKPRKVTKTAEAPASA